MGQRTKYIEQKAIEGSYYHKLKDQLRHWRTIKRGINAKMLALNTKSNEADKEITNLSVKISIIENQKRHELNAEGRKSYRAEEIIG